MHSIYIVIFTVAVALVFDLINGFHDSANSIATVVSTRVLSPRMAVLWAAFFNFVAMFVFAPKVADTVSKIVVIDPNDNAYVYVVLTGLLGAIVWDLLTWVWGLPTSSSHALIGGFVGAGIAHKGLDVIHWGKVGQTVAYIPLAPLFGLVLGFILMVAVFWLFRRWRPTAVDRVFRRGQLFSAALYSLGHGGNDAQKTMGIIVALLVAAGHFKPDVKLSLTDPRDALDHSFVQPGHGVGHRLWRLAHREDHGHEDHKAETRGRVLRGDGRSHHTFRGHALRYSGLHDAHHHRRHHRRRVHYEILDHQMGRRPQHHVGVGAHHPPVGPRFRRLLLHRQDAASGVLSGALRFPESPIPAEPRAGGVRRPHFPARGYA